MGLDIEVVIGKGECIYHERFGSYSAFRDLRVILRYIIEDCSRRHRVDGKADDKVELTDEDKEAHDIFRKQCGSDRGFNAKECVKIYRFLKKFELPFEAFEKDLEIQYRVIGPYRMLMEAFKLAVDSKGRVKFC